MNSAGTILKNIFFFLVNFMVVMATLFIFFRDGERLLHWIIDITPMDAEHKYRIANQLYITTIAVVRGLLLTADHWLVTKKDLGIFRKRIFR